MSSKARVALIGTLDTKGAEIAYVRERLAELGMVPLVIDSGILGEPAGCSPEITRAEVALAGGHTLEEVRAAPSRGAAVEMMIRGTRAVCVGLFERDELDGVLCLGGAEGAALGAAAMQALPVGVPKVLVSPSASGQRTFAPFVGESDTLVMHSVVDILGLNPIARSVFDNAAGAVAGMVKHGGGSIDELDKRSVGMTMLGQTTPGVQRVYEVLADEGIEPVIFHANGVGGPAMERLAADDALGGVIDYTLSELANTVMNGIHATGRDRLCTAGRLGLRQVVVPGCVDFFNQGALQTVPPQYLERKHYKHNPTATLVRLLPNEMVMLGELIARRLNESRGPLVVVVPERGFSLVGSDGGILWDPESDAAFNETFCGALRDDVHCERVDMAINDRAFADHVAARYLELLS